MIDLRERICARLIREAYLILKEKNHLPSPIILAGNKSEAWLFPGAIIRSANSAAIISLGATWYGIIGPYGTIEVFRGKGRKKETVSVMTDSLCVISCVDGETQMHVFALQYEDRKFVGLAEDSSEEDCVLEAGLFEFEFKDDVPLKDQLEEIQTTVRPLLEPILRPIRLDDL